MVHACELVVRTCELVIRACELVVRTCGRELNSGREVPMAARPDYLKHVPWFPDFAFEQSPPSADFTPATNGIVSSLLSPEERARLRAMNAAPQNR